MKSETTRFEITPSQEQLDQMNRDLSFVPADPERATTFAPAEVQRFNETGYLAPVDLLREEEAERCRDYFDGLLAAYLAAGKDSYSISTAHLKHSGVYDLLTDSRIVQRVRDLLGDDVIGWGSHYFCKLPGDGKRVSWHQDAGYWPLTPSRTVTVWLAVDDSDTENGCMRVLPGTHRRGAIEFDRSQSTEGNVLDQTIQLDDSYPEPVDIALRAGQMSIHSDLLVHGSEPNTSERRRCGLTLRYCSADVNAYLEWNRKGVVVAGEADPQRWPGAPRPSDQ